MQCRSSILLEAKSLVECRGRRPKTSLLAAQWTITEICCWCGTDTPTLRVVRVSRRRALPAPAGMSDRRPRQPAKAPRAGSIQKSRHWPPRPVAISRAGHHTSLARSPTTITHPNTSHSFTTHHTRSHNVHRVLDLILPPGVRARRYPHYPVLQVASLEP